MNDLTRKVLEQCFDLTKLTKKDLIDTVEELVFNYSELEKKNKEQMKAFEDGANYALRLADQSLNLRKALEHRKLAELAELQANRPDAF